MNKTEQVGLYYQAVVPAETCWFFTAILRSQEHLCFDRAIDKTRSIVEFFVPVSNQQEFESFLGDLERHALVHSLKQLPNRFADLDVVLHLHDSVQEVGL